MACRPRMVLTISQVKHELHHSPRGRGRGRERGRDKETLGMNCKLTGLHVTTQRSTCRLSPDFIKHKTQKPLSHFFQWSTCRLSPDFLKHKTQKPLSHFFPFHTSHAISFSSLLFLFSLFSSSSYSSPQTKEIQHTVQRERECARAEILLPRWSFPTAPPLWFIVPFFFSLSLFAVAVSIWYFSRAFSFFLSVFFFSLFSLDWRGPGIFLAFLFGFDIVRVYCSFNN